MVGPRPALLGVTLLFVIGAATTAGGKPRAAVPAKPDNRAITHVLNRLGYGPRPGDVERVRRIGLAGYIDQQLHPERIDDSALAARLSTFDTLSLSSSQLAKEYYLPAMEERRRLQREQPPAIAAATATAATMRPAAATAERERKVMADLVQQKLLRAIYSERQLQEVMTDFWLNHFNVFAGKGPTRVYVSEYERDAIRPNALGKFRDLLEATAKSPAMLFYLDNWMSGAPSKYGVPIRDRGFNENYGRELLELHTLGVDGGYTQQDVIEVARAFTGWTITNPREGGGFRFDPRRHDDGPKLVLGHRIAPNGGEDDGEQVLDILARHPATARFIAAKLARRFVSDNPPHAIIDRATARFRETDGDIREVVKTIVTSPEFFSRDAYRAKVKTPLEYVVSAARALDVDVDDARPIGQALKQMGMAPYMCQPPAGYRDMAADWISAGALLNRMDFALALATGRLHGSRVDFARLAGRSETDALREFSISTILGGDAADITRSTLARATTPPPLVVALALGAPEFQLR